MIDEFVRDTRTGRLVGSFRVPEAAVLAMLSGSVIELLRDGQPVAPADRDPFEALLDFSGPQATPEDPALARLLPDAYSADPEASADFRRYTESTLRSDKIASAEVIRESLAAAGLTEASEPDVVIDVELDDETAQRWLRGLNDVRLALGTRLGLGAEPDDTVIGTAAVQMTAALYDYASYVQSSLLAGLSDDYAEPVSLRLTRATYDAIVAHAKRDHPDEACGVVAGPAGSDRPTRFVPMINAAGSPTFYEFDSGELLSLYKEMDDRDEEPVIIYHSHSATEAYPSRTDINLAMEPGAHYVLVSTREHGNNDGPVEFRSFRIIDGDVTEEAVVIVDNPEEL